MTRMIRIRLVNQTVRISPNWAGQGIAIHKPLTIANGKVGFKRIQGYWMLTHIATGRSLGFCMGDLDRAKGFARAWDAEFAALQPGRAMAPDRLKAWKAVVEEMKQGPTGIARCPGCGDGPEA